MNEALKDYLKEEISMHKDSIVQDMIHYGEALYEKGYVFAMESILLMLDHIPEAGKMV